jgi:hypothetical protein
MTESIHYIDVALRIQFDPAQLPNILKVGRQLTQANIQNPVDNHNSEDESARPLTDEEVAEDVTSIQDCIGEILRAHPLLEQLKMQIVATMIGEEQSASGFAELPPLDLLMSQPSRLAPVEPDDSEWEGEDPLDEFNETGLFLCRWPNGDCSVVAATSKRDAILQLDEFGAAEPGMLHPIGGCMLDFGLTESGDLELNEMGEETRAVIYETCYPHLSEMLGSKELQPLYSDSPTEQEKKTAIERLRVAVETEKKRLWDAGAPRGAAKTELGKEIQRQMGASSVVADHYADQIGENFLEEFHPKGEKPN